MTKSLFRISKEVDPIWKREKQKRVIDCSKNVKILKVDFHLGYQFNEYLQVSYDYKDMSLVPVAYMIMQQ